MKRKWAFTGTTEGSFPTTCRVFDNNMKEVAVVNFTVVVASAIITNPFSVVSVGDSLTNQKPWTQEVRDLSGNQISFVGTRGTTTGRKHEGRSGATAAYYLGNNSYTFDTNGIDGNDGRPQNLNPFWNPNTGAFDFHYYKSNYNLNPDRVFIWLGTNGISLNPDTNAGNIKSIVDGIRNEDPSIPIYVAFTLFRANQDGIGKQTGSDGYVAAAAWKLQEDRKVFNLQVKLYDLLKDYSDLYFVPISLCHDSEYNFGAVSTPVNPRASQVEFLPVEATHPQEQGYLQIADILFSVLACTQ